MKKMIVTGGAGFIGSNFIRYILSKYNDYEIANIDLLTYSGNLENLQDVENNPHYRFIQGNIADKTFVYSIIERDVDVVVNFAAESHVDRSIMDSYDFLRTNVLGTQVLLETVREKNIPLFVQISTDEVYGSLGETGLFKETTPLSPRSPYSASKASADLLVMAYYETHKTPVIITRCSNNYGPYQFPEKLIPLMIINALNDKELPVYGDGLNVRDWINVIDHCEALDRVIHKGKIGEIYNVGANNEWRNIDIVKLVLDKLNKPYSLIKFVKDRPGHDRRYAIDSTKIQTKLGWSPQINFDKGIEETIQWYKNNKSWWEKIMSGEYKNYYKKMYGDRLKEGQSFKQNK